MHDEKSSRNMGPLVLVGSVAVLALVGVGVLAGILIGQGKASTTTVTNVSATTTATAATAASAAPAASKSSTSTVVVEQAAAPPSTVTIPASAPSEVTATGTWPAATSAWTVVLASTGSKPDAEAIQSRASSAGLPDTGILLSTDHSSLRPGYWVAFTGVLDHSGAVSRQAQARAAGFSDAYARFVSAN